MLVDGDEVTTLRGTKLRKLRAEKLSMVFQHFALQQETGTTIVFITHDLNEAMRLGDRVAVMRDGRVVQIGTAEEILNDPANDYVASFVADVDRTRPRPRTRVGVEQS